ncbi:hypothetical protein RA269_29080, partial [Pseudomonas syringae pv. tagetis]|uniref:hypothetical protein n=1 Tax=Pseudomonas syringae group genomosp. 7 TaxID=251699 RepID=UPI00376FAA3E
PPLSIRVGNSVLPIDAPAAVLYSQATTPQPATTLLPRTALVPASEAALVASQKKNKNEFSGTPHRFQ